MKNTATDLALFGGDSLFATPKSTSNLVRPDIENFLAYSKQFYRQRQYTNNGPLVQQLEKRLATLHQTDYCVTFCSGFWALALAISAMARKGKSEIVMPSLTYRRMADIAAWNRLSPHFCDIDPASLAMSAATAETCINDKTALMLCVHPIVNCCDAEELCTLARHHDIPVLFDAVESVYETVPEGKVGQFGDAEIFSLHASKLINGFEGGYVTTNNRQLAEHLSLARGFGFKQADNITVPGGMNAKLNEVHAAMALSSLDDLEDQVIRNRERYRLYQTMLQPISGLQLLAFDENQHTSYKNIVVRLCTSWPLTRADTLRILHAEKIVARPYYSPALHQKDMAYPHIAADLPETDQMAEQFLLLPCGHHVNDHDIRQITALLAMMLQQAPAIRRKLESL
ncbi:aminotransferase class I/II-fold pyridoxal phosphate-dependent enzyme [Janthinobacterium sp. RB2R34]|uniref:aminotransferase class I/II-fold pyridoxal phosphate-dependent enzyme n=1 Tax=Janthinobacterium sp. RB2R34 TaxID=3424193 RepID=UPI003F223578